MNDVFAQRRSRVLDQLGDTAALIVAAAPEMIIGRDTELRYVPDSELYYLTGYTEPEAVLVLHPEQEGARFTLFVRERDSARELWTGKRGGVEAAREHFGADAAYPIAELAKQLPGMVGSVDRIYARLGSGRPDVDAVLQRILNDARARRARLGTGAHTITEAGELLDAMRLVKDAEELRVMREAARITCESFSDTIARMRSGIGEWEVEASIEYGFRLRGASAAFPTIAAAGANATVLHYIENRHQSKADDLLLIDAGARYRMYCADVTRTVPVSGKFTAEQRDLYDIVLAAHDAAINAVRPGATTDSVHTAAQRILAEGLLQLGLLKGTIDELIEREDGLKRYYPHKTSHWVGLDVHDVGAYATREGPARLAPNMVLTIEPGLYLAERGIGIRIEDDVLVTSDGYDVLTREVPIA